MPQKRNIQSSEPSAQTSGHNGPKKYSIWQKDNRKICLALALLIASLVLTCVAALYVKMKVESIARKEFDFACNEIKSRILIRVQQHAQILRSASAFYEINENITREQWHNSIAHLNIEQVLPGIQGIGYAIIIPPDLLALHERKIRNEGFPQYAVKPTGKREIYTSIIYIEPFSERNLRAFGYDMFSEPIRRKAMEHARDFDEATLSGKITLVQETDKDIQAGTLMYVPVYERGLPVRTIEERRRAIRGWVYSPYRMNDLMRGILGGWEHGEGRQIRLEVFDATSFQSEALLYDSGPGQKLELTSATMFREQTSILFNDHRWSLRFTQIGDHTGIVDYSKAWYVVIGGTVVSALLFALYLLLINANYRAHALAEALTRELRESTERKLIEERLAEKEAISHAIASSAHDAILMMDNSGNISFWNPAAERILGWKTEEALGKTLHDLIVPERFREAHIKASSAFRHSGEGASLGKKLELAALKKDSTEIDVELSLSGVRLKGAWNAVGILRDITERRQSEEQIRQMAHHDSLTGLPNRKLFSDRLGIALTQAQRNQKEVGIVMLDLDNFKGVNDTLGHDVGDLLLQETAERLSAALRKGDTVARFGGDEFALILPDLKVIEDAIRVAQKIVDGFRKPFLIDTHQLFVTTSIGIAVYPHDGMDEGILLKNADIAMYQAKQTGRDRYQIYKEA